MAENTKLVRKQVEEIKLSFGSMLLLSFCTCLLIFATFIQCNVTHIIIPGGLFHGEHLTFKDFLFTFKYIPQIPIVMFVGAFLDRKYGIISILLYILLGLLVIPVFALGGGPKYIFEYGFGYIMAYIPAVFFASSILKSGFSIRNILHATIVGVLTIHFFGVLYMLFIAGLRHEGWAFMSGWIVNQSGIKIIYDIIFSFAALFLTRYLKIILWFFM